MQADDSENEQLSSSSSATKPDDGGAEASVALALSVGIFVNKTIATIDSDAQLDAHDAISVMTTNSYPLLIDNPTDPFDPTYYLTNTGPLGYSYAQDGTLGYSSDLFNTFVTTDASGADVGVGGGFAYNQYTNTSQATIDSGALINQQNDARYRTGDQTVTVSADTDMLLIGAVGNVSLGLNLSGATGAASSFKDYAQDLKDAIASKSNLYDGIKELVNPLRRPRGRSPGHRRALDPGREHDEHHRGRDPGPGAKVHAGWSRTFDPTTAVANDEIKLGAPLVLPTGTAVMYTSGPGGAPIGGLTDGTTYYVIADPVNPDGLKLALTADDAMAGNAITLDPSTAAGSDHELVDVDAGSGVTVTSMAPVFDLGIAEAGDNSSGLGVSGAFTIGLITNTTYARIDSGALIDDDGDLNVTATDNLDLRGSRSNGGRRRRGQGQNVGVGIALSVNVLSRDTQAYIGAGYDSNGNLLPAGSAGTNIVVSGPITVAADTTGAIWSAALAGSKTQPEPPKTTPSDDMLAQNAPPAAAKVLGIDQSSSGSTPQVQKLLGVGDQEESSLSIAGDISFNLTTKQNTYAFINDTGTVTSAQAVAATATDDAAIWSLAGAVALAIGGSGNSKGLAGSLSINIINANAQAFVAGATINAQSLDVSATRGGGIRSLTAGGAGATAAEGTSVAGSVSANVALVSTIAYVSAATLVLALDSSVTAKDTSDIWSIAGAIAYGGASGFGISLALNLLGTTDTPDLTQAYITGTSIMMATGTLSVTATNEDATSDPRIVAITGAAGAGAGDGKLSGAGMISVNMIVGGAEATMTDSTVTQAAGDGTVGVIVAATDTSGIVSIGGAVGVSGGSGFGAAIGYNEITNTVLAKLDGVGMDMSGALSVTAVSDASIVGVAIGVAVSKSSGLAAAGSASINLIEDTVGANVVGDPTLTPAPVIQVGGPVLIAATDTSTIVSVAGGVSISAGGNAVGAAITYNLIQNMITATIEDATIHTMGTLQLIAGSTPELVSVAAGVGASSSEELAIGGSVSVNSIANTIDAHISGGSDVTAQDDITITGTQAASMVAVAGALAVSSATALAGAFSYNYIGATVDPANPVAGQDTTNPQNAISAYIDGSTVTTQRADHHRRSRVAGRPRLGNAVNPPEVARRDVRRVHRPWTRPTTPSPSAARRASRPARQSFTIATAARSPS